MVRQAFASDPILYKDPLKPPNNPPIHPPESENISAAVPSDRLSRKMYISRSRENRIASMPTKLSSEAPEALNATNRDRNPAETINMIGSSLTLLFRMCLKPQKFDDGFNHLWQAQNREVRPALLLAPTANGVNKPAVKYIFSLLPILTFTASYWKVLPTNIMLVIVSRIFLGADEDNLSSPIKPRPIAVIPRTAVIATQYL